jgi:hypothetical protein
MKRLPPQDRKALAGLLEDFRDAMTKDMEEYGNQGA